MRRGRQDNAIERRARAASRCCIRRDGNSHCESQLPQRAVAPVQQAEQFARWCRFSFTTATTRQSDSRSPFRSPTPAVHLPRRAKCLGHACHDEGLIMFAESNAATPVLRGAGLHASSMNRCRHIADPVRTR